MSIFRLSSSRTIVTALLSLMSFLTTSAAYGGASEVYEDLHIPQDNEAYSQFHAGAQGCPYTLEELVAMDLGERETAIAKLIVVECRSLANAAIGLRSQRANAHARLTEQQQRLLGAGERLQGVEQLLGKRLYEFEVEKLNLEKDAPKGPDTIAGLQFDVFSYPRVDGSTSAWPLARLIACRLLDVPYTWKATPLETRGDAYSTSYVGSEYFFVRHDLEACVEPREYERAGRMINESLVNHTGTHTAYVNLVDGKTDFILVAREPSQDELEHAEGKTKLDVRRVAHDAFVFIVNADNPVESLTARQIRDIYINKITQWKQVGAEGGQIVPFRREENSGSQELMESEVMKELWPNGQPNTNYDDYLIGGGMGGPFHQLRNNPNGIAFSVYFYEKFMAVSPFTKVIAINGVHPSRDTIADGTYPFVTGVYAVIRSESSDDHPARKLRDWLLTGEGQAVIGESGYVPVNSGR